MKYMCLWAVAEKAPESKEMRVSWFSLGEREKIGRDKKNGSHQGCQRVQLIQPSEAPPAQTVGLHLKEARSRSHCNPKLRNLIVLAGWVFAPIAGISQDRQHQPWCTFFKPVYFFSIQNGKCLPILAFL